MSVQLYTQEQIVHHVENASPTKFMYTFGKAPRFQEIDKRGKTDSIYNLPSQKMNRTAAIGFGNKSDFTKKNYRGTEFISIKRDYDKGNQPGFKYTFGLARDKLERQVVPGYKNLDLNVPGPAKYDIIKKTGSESPKYSLHIICGETQWINRHMKNPGPGAYTPLVRINTEGKYPISKISNIKANNFGLDKSDRWNLYKPNGVPGPNAYFADKTLMGNIYNSKFRSGHFITMSDRLPKFGYKNDYPGPGSYLHFSEFGILVPKNYKNRVFSANPTSNNDMKTTNYETFYTEGNKKKNKKTKTVEK